MVSKKVNKRIQEPALDVLYPSGMSSTSAILDPIFCKKNR